MLTLFDSLRFVGWCHWGVCGESWYTARLVINELSFHPILCLYCIGGKNYLMKLIFVFTEEEQDDEEVYKMASIMSSSGGLEAMLNRYFVLSYGIFAASIAHLWREIISGTHFSPFCDSLTEWAPFGEKVVIPWRWATFNAAVYSGNFDVFSFVAYINFIVCCCFQPWPRVHSVVKLNISTFKVAAKNCPGLISYLKFIQHIIQCRIQKCFTKSFSFGL